MYTIHPETPMPPSTISVLDGSFHKNQKNVYLDGAMPLYKIRGDNPIMKVAPAPPPKFTNGNRPEIMEAFDENGQIRSKIYEALKPMFLTLRTLGIFPITSDGTTFSTTSQWIGYSLALLFAVLGYTGYLKWQKNLTPKSVEGRFEEAVIDYLFTVYLIPIVINPITLYEARKQANVLTQMIAFEKIYSRISKKRLNLNLGAKPLIITIMLLVLGCGTMITTHLTMSTFIIYQVIPYCYINVITYMMGGAWYVYCEIIATIATTLAEEFQFALKNIGPSTRVSDYRSLWMLLSRIIRNVGNSFGYALTFLCLYLFFVITLTIYGLLSQIQEGMGIKDIGLFITGFSAVIMLFFICDKAHYASACVRTYFQKKILLVELSWMNEDAQQEINMFLRATEMNPVDMCLCGFFDVNRNLFKSLLATMVTYLVVLLQFQISIPENEEESPKHPLNSTIYANITASF
ncbi:gustatory and odorant receptor 24 [Anthonomus grandis grandis]|uniref:gustatory and odorant receptor 24 n=1 Tax=Anthonomus grandis grandis TaxID=2921223 RepID=UPI002165DF2A|nr:gustatory and odorant receptor 24 [Anthonomus grandis grandis]